MRRLSPVQFTTLFITCGASTPSATGIKHGPQFQGRTRTMNDRVSVPTTK